MLNLSPHFMPKKVKKQDEILKKEEFNQILN